MSDKKEKKEATKDVESSVPSVVADSVLKSSEGLEGHEIVRGFDWDNTEVTFDNLFGAYRTTGFQATNLYRAIEEINRMLEWRLSDEPITDEDLEMFRDEEFRKNYKCKIFLGYTSNLVSSGLRETLKFLLKHKMVDVVVSTAGGIEEDIIKCLGPTYMGDFALKGKGLRARGINRIGNLLVPNENYCKFEDFMIPLFDKMAKEQEEDGVRWTPKTFIWRLGKEINNEDSICYWAYKNKIPIYSPALTDGSIGDMLYFYSYRNEKFMIDIVKDIRSMNDEAAYHRKTGMIILGGGLIKHHIANANLMGGGADFSVYINTATEYDGSDSGARPDEAVSWGKIKDTAKPVKVYGEATLLFPIVVAQTFYKYYKKHGDRR